MPNTARYLTGAEVEQVAKVIRFAEEFEGGDLSLEIQLTDANGENVGRVGYTDGGTYGYMPD